MTVKQLRHALGKMPPDAVVGWRDHDAGDGDVSAFVKGVHLQESEEEWEYDPHRPADLVEAQRRVGVILHG